MPFVKGQPKTPGSGRKKGTPNRFGIQMREDIAKALEQAHPGGRVAYLTKLAREEPRIFGALIMKAMPANIDATLAAAVEKVVEIRDYTGRSNPDGSTQEQLEDGNVEDAEVVSEGPVVRVSR